MTVDSVSAVTISTVVEDEGAGGGDVDWDRLLLSDWDAAGIRWFGWYWLVLWWCLFARWEMGEFLETAGDSLLLGCRHWAHLAARGQLR